VHGYSGHCVSPLKEDHGSGGGNDVGLKANENKEDGGYDKAEFQQKTYYLYMEND
jgi:hypothetical protein